MNRIKKGLISISYRKIPNFCLELRYCSHKLTVPKIATIFSRHFRTFCIITAISLTQKEKSGLYLAKDYDLQSYGCSER